MNDDAVLLRRYLEERSEDAFTRLVHRYVDLVYSAALRRTGGDPHHAADVAQEVFTALARQARSLAQHPVLGAWLHATTRNIAINLMLSEQRRKQRQQTALALETVQAANVAPEWERVRPAIDAAIDELPEGDRLPVVLRFLERRPFKEIGAALAISEDAARVRTDRALEKLRVMLARRGITSTAAALGAAVSAHGTVTAPAGLGAVLAAESLAATAGSAGVLAAAVTGLMSAKILSVAAASAVIAFSLGTYTSGSRAATPAAPTAVVAQTTGVNASLREENERLKAELQRLSSDFGNLNATHAKLLAERSAPAPARTGRALGMPRHEIQQSMINNLRQIAAARDQYQYENKRPASSIHELVGSDSFVRRVTPVDGEDYTGLSMAQGSTLMLTSASGVTVMYGDTVETTKVDMPPAVARAHELEEKVDASMKAAIEAYRLANQGKDPEKEEALLSFFATPQQGADFLEYLEAQKEARKY